MWIILVFVTLVAVLIVILISTARGARSVRPEYPPAVPRLIISLTAGPPIICSGDVVALTWRSTGDVAERIEQTNESAVEVESGGTPATMPSPSWDRTSTEPTHTENVTVYENWYFRATAVSGTNHFTASVRVTVFQPGEWMTLSSTQDASDTPPRVIRIVCGSCEGQVELTGTINLPPEDWSSHLRAHRIRLRPGFDRPVMIVHHLGSHFELHPGDPPVDTRDMPIAGEWLLCTPARIQDCPDGEDLTHVIGGQPGVPNLDLEIEVACV
jgi:hypothetical protein